MGKSRKLRKVQTTIVSMPGADKPKKIRCRNHQWQHHDDQKERNSWRLCQMCGTLQGKKMLSGQRWKTVDYVKPEGPAPMPGMHSFSVGKHPEIGKA